jgi:CTP-dependent riboflavin kinase
MEKKMVLIGISLLTFALAGGGNPEVNVINKCFKKKGEKKFLCLDKFYPGDLNITIFPHTTNQIKLAGRKSSIEIGKFELKNQDRFILSVDVSNVKLPISSNIATAKITKYGSNRVIDIAVKDIRNQIILYDRYGKLLLKYTIIK